MMYVHPFVILLSSLILTCVQVRRHSRLAHRRIRSTRDQRTTSFDPLLRNSKLTLLKTQLGVIPGAGGTQRLTHAIGKSRAMEIVLTGKNLSAIEAASWGLISRVVEEGSVVDEAVKVATKISQKGRVAVQAGKEGVNAGSFFVPRLLFLETDAGEQRTS